MTEDKEWTQWNIIHQKNSCYKVKRPDIWSIPRTISNLVGSVNQVDRRSQITP